MKKCIILILLSLGIFSCSTSSIRKGTISGLIIGQWKGVKFGNVVVQLGLSLPAIYTFNDDNTYECSLTIEGSEKKYKGIYEIHNSKNPAWITVRRNDGRLFHGIVEFKNNNLFKMVLYDKKILPRPMKFNISDVQIYKRIN